MSDTGITAPEGSARDEDARSPEAVTRVSRGEALRVLAEASHLWKLAEHVQGRRAVGSVDSAILSHRALTLLLGLVTRLHGDPVPDDFSALADFACAIAEREGFFAESHRPDLTVMAETRDLLASGSEVTGKDDRRYDRAFLRSTEWFGATRSYLDQQIPAGDSRLLDYLTLGIAVAMAFGLGLIVGRQQAPRVAQPAFGSAPTASTTTTGAAFIASFYRDPSFNELVLTRRDTGIAFDWGARAPMDSMPTDGFSVRWEGTLFVATAGKHSFSLTSDDGSRLFIDGALTVDNWGNHSEHTEEATLELSHGPHQIRVEYFDKLGPAMIRLEWSSDRFSRRLLSSADLR